MRQILRLQTGECAGTVSTLEFSRVPCNFPIVFFHKNVLQTIQKTTKKELSGLVQIFKREAVTMQNKIHFSNIGSFITSEKKYVNYVRYVRIFEGVFPMPQKLITYSISAGRDQSIRRRTKARTSRVVSAADPIPVITRLPCWNFRLWTRP